MRLLPSDPDVETIVSRIKNGDIDLQPNFQRGEVWGRPKKQRLIDSILRDWHVPPIHVIENPKTRKQEVLDGQQRLASIRDFVDCAFPVDGNIEPLDPSIQSLNGKNYSNLPEDSRRTFNQFTIRIFRIVDYKPSEPAELFFRLNQPASLTGAEQRNAFFGPVREQIRELVTVLENKGLIKAALAFSNSRMAYDDVLARTALAVERRRLDEKITSSALAALYRRNQPLGPKSIELVERAIDLFAEGVLQKQRSLPKFNKATVFSWLMFLVRGMLSGNPPTSGPELGEFLSYFQAIRNTVLHESESGNRLLAGSAPAGRLLAIYETRASARVADVSSVVLRDAVLWLAYEDFLTSRGLDLDPWLKGLKALHAVFRPRQVLPEDDLIARKLIEQGWGIFR